MSTITPTQMPTVAIPPARVPFLDLIGQNQVIWEAFQDRLVGLWQGSRFVNGPDIEQFERAFAAYCGVQHCVSVNSGTSALHLALQCLGVGPGDEVITVPMTFIATVEAISYVDATPVLVDIDPVTRTMAPQHLEAAITSRTKAILPVHLYGQVAAMESILAIAQAHHLPIIEDAAQAHGAIRAGRRAGSFGHMGCFSFYPSKNLGACGEGGALVTDDNAIAARARALRNHGQVSRHCHRSVGHNYRMDSLQALVLSLKLPHLDAWNQARRKVAATYRRLLYGHPTIHLPDALSGGVYHLFVIETDDRDRWAQVLQRAGVDTGLHYPTPVHLQPAYRGLGHRRGDFPVAERLARRCLSLPMYPHLSTAAIETVCELLWTSPEGGPRCTQRTDQPEQTSCHRRHD